MTSFVSSSGIALTLLLMSAPGFSAAAEPAKRSKSLAPLHTLFSPDDYPVEAIRNREEGTVGFLLSVGTDGRVANCSIESSSGSRSLDETTCRLLRERVRFEPATNASGKPVPDTHRSRIVWQLPTDIPPSLEAALNLWTTCVMGEVAKLSISNLSMPEITNRAFQGCAELEALFASESAKAKLKGSDPSSAVADVKEQFTTKIAPDLEKMRAALKTQER